MDHWHPVLNARDLGPEPVGTTLNNTEIVLFRTQDGRIGALNDECPHRRMRLSKGKVVDARLQCPYHGWTFSIEGAGESPGTPKLYASHTCYDVKEAHGAIWLKAASAEASFPEFEVEEFAYACTTRHIAPAPLEVVLDNFTEVEHTSTTHLLLGYDLAGMAQVETRIEATDDAVYVYNEGPQKRVSPFFRLLMGFKPGDFFVDEWTTRFSPVHARYDQWWFESKSRQARRDRLRIYVFFNPIDADRTELVTFVFIRSRFGTGPILQTLVSPILKKLVNVEVGLDVAMLGQLADKRPGIEGMRLSRFDKVLGLHRKRIDAIYRGMGPLDTVSPAVEPHSAHG